MEVLYTKTAEEGSEKAYQLIREALDNGAKVFGLATGSTPERVYEKLVESDVDFSEAISVNLDEYVGLEGTHEQSYQYFMEQKLFNHKPFKESFVPNGVNEEQAEIERYEAILAKYPIDLQILGIGENGHIAFNEPGTALDSVTHKVELTQSTINANKRNFEKEEDVPRYAYSMGLASIMKAKKIILMAFGENKAQAVKDLVTATKADPAIPSTVLVNHPDVTVIVDKAAATLIKK
ncbi:Glucosamine-6-phosphate deaminase [Jeotgalibaca dankookensis]|uniref:Glucosamine-6-phosphate deaminase n=1 Tax=Jeotgalibaca dankookensis TaxID=708126 RepID=A0A1S6IRC7_9LACT|nr:glucosamine-6-phosphate deaminase [Jeotgalibaca dankookensis]AQS54103.1 Glucosamine-6-phosphate deaminase [Jeotgalibaca dankookensis]